MVNVKRYALGVRRKKLNVKWYALDAMRLSIDLSFQLGSLPAKAGTGTQFFSKHLTPYQHYTIHIFTLSLRYYITLLSFPSSRESSKTKTSG